MITISKTRTSLLAAACVSVLALGACGQNEGATSNGSATSNSASATQSPKTMEKYNAYTDGYNELIGTFGAAYQYDRYLRLNIPSASATADLNFPSNVSLFERAIGKIKEGRAINGGNATEAADAAADKLIASGDALIAKWKDLEPYYQSKAYRDDALAKGKAAHEELVAAYVGLLDGINQLDTVLTEQGRAQNAQRIADLRKSGEDNAANLIDASAQAEVLVSHALADEIPEADAGLANLEAAIAKARETQAAMSDGDINKSHYDMTLDALTDVVGAFRNLKQSPGDSNKDAVLRAYNESVTAMNRADLPA